MVDFTLNGERRQGPAHVENWAQLLDLLEQGSGPGRQVVTAVRFDGVEEPTFRTPSALARELEEFGPVAVETSSVQDLLHESARSAAESIGPLEDAVDRTAAAFRRQDLPRANRSLADLMAALRTLTNITAVVAAVLSAEGGSEVEIDSLVTRLSSVVDRIITQQASETWSAVAATLEDDLAPVVARWSAILQALRGNASRLQPLFPVSSLPCAVQGSAPRAVEMMS